MFKTIKGVIDNWDPIGLLVCSPPDEYDVECVLIKDRLSSGKETLSEIIYDVFSQHFGEAFRCELSECMEVAAEIEKQMP